MHPFGPVIGGAALGLAMIGAATPAAAQTLVVLDDEYGIPFAEPLVVEAPGVLDNDTVDGEPAADSGAIAMLVTGAAHGSLSLATDGSFTYSPGPTFDGFDEFTYEAAVGAVTAQATVTLSACSGGPVYDCWNENAFRTKVAGFGYGTWEEGFEDPDVWGGVRVPSTAMSVTSRGITWRSNHPDPPASNPITTGTGAGHDGQWGVFDPFHGYATGTTGDCDVDNPPVNCLYYDGVSGTREAGGSALHAVGAYVHGMFGARIVMTLDGGAQTGGGQLWSAGHQFFGLIDTSPGGFTDFSFLEIDGKVGQALYVWLDDFILAGDAATGVEPVSAATTLRFEGAAPNPTTGSTTLRFDLPVDTWAALSIHDVGGRLVRRLPGGSGGGAHAVSWDGRDREGRPVPSGVYFARLVARTGAADDVRMRKIIVTR